MSTVPINFLGKPQVRGKELKLAACHGCAQVGTWEAADAEARLAGAAASLPATMTPPEYLEQVQESAGEVADFFRRLARVLQPSVDNHRLALARALRELNPLPATMQNVLQQRSPQGAAWRDLTAPENVAWAVHDGQTEPWWDLCIVKGSQWETLQRSSIYSTILVKLVMSGIEEIVADKSPADRLQALQATCVHFNTAAAECGQEARILMAVMDQRPGRPWKFDLAPADISRQYGGRTRRITQAQAASGAVAEGRARRVLQRTG